MHGPRRRGPEWSESDWEVQTSYDIPYVWNLKRNDTNELTKQKVAKSENKLMVAQGREEGDG